MQTHSHKAIKTDTKQKKVFFKLNIKFKGETFYRSALLQSAEETLK
jgi:hypothetical protein